MATERLCASANKRGFGLKKAGRTGGGVGHSQAGGGQSNLVKGRRPSLFNNARAGAGPPQPSLSVASATLNRGHFHQLVVRFLRRMDSIAVASVCGSLRSRCFS